MKVGKCSSIVIAVIFGIFCLAIYDYPNKYQVPILDLLNRWQILITAVVALVGAALAYLAATEKVRSDERIERSRRRADSTSKLDKFRDYSATAGTQAQQFLSDISDDTDFTQMVVYESVWRIQVSAGRKAEKMFESTAHEFSNEELADIRLFLYNWRSIEYILHPYRANNPDSTKVDIEEDIKNLKEYLSGASAGSDLAWHLASHAIERYSERPISRSMAKDIERATKELREAALKANEFEGMRRFPF